MYKIEADYIWVILKNVGQTFFKIMTNRLDKGGFFFSESFRLRCKDNFIGKRIPHYYFRDLNSWIDLALRLRQTAKVKLKFAFCQKSKKLV